MHLYVYVYKYHIYKHCDEHEHCNDHDNWRSGGLTLGSHLWMESTSSMKPVYERSDSNSPVMLVWFSGHSRKNNLVLPRWPLQPQLRAPGLEKASLQGASLCFNLLWDELDAGSDVLTCVREACPQTNDEFIAGSLSNSGWYWNKRGISCCLRMRSKYVYIILWSNQNHERPEKTYAW